MKTMVFCVQSAALLLIGLALAGCSKSNDGEGGVNAVSIPASSNDYVVFAWNDLGMHCLNPTYDEAVLLPPYNTVWAQVIKRGNPPEIVTTNVTVDYAIVDNTFSYGKTDALGGSFAQFWDHSLELFGVELAHNTGLNLADPNLHNGLAGAMVQAGDHFAVHGIPVTPVSDAGVWSPYQVAEVTARIGGNVIAQTRATVPTSDEIHCSRCHEAEQGKSTFQDILEEHDEQHATSLVAQKPVLCAECHGSPALGLMEAGTSGKFLSQAIHGSHASRGAGCYDCHPGPVTVCNRSLAHTAVSGNCDACHVSMAQVAASIASGARVPWVGEPQCVTCHSDVSGVDTGATLYRNAKGHGGLYCAACHQSPHAMVPSREAADNYQSVHDQSSDKTIGSCGVCHTSSRGAGSDGFGGAHGGTGGRVSACRVCHTVVPTNTADWPHAYQWHSR